MTPFIRAYLRASTHEQDATRAKSALNAFALNQKLVICNYYIENESGATLQRPELFRLLADCQSQDVLLVNYNYINKPKKRDKWDKTGLGGIMWDRKSEKEFQKLRGLNCPFFMRFVLIRRVIASF